MEAIREFVSRRRSKKQKEQLAWIGVGLASLVMFFAGLGASAWLFPKPIIGLVYVDAVISTSGVGYFTVPLHYAQDHREVAAVVLIVNSPGGSASTSEELFYRTVELRSQKPVVVSTHSINASGAYYISMGANYIFAKPAAIVGSIGVVSGIPSDSGLDEFEATTGPFKASGSTEVDWIRGLESIKNSFVNNVFEQRSYFLERMHPESRAELLPDRAHIATGQVWFAQEAYDRGIIDALGSDLDAIEKAAELAHVSNYDIVDLTGLTLFDNPTFLFSADLSDRPAEFFGGEPELIQEGPWPSFYHLYLPPDD